MNSPNEMQEDMSVPTTYPLENMPIGAIMERPGSRNAADDLTSLEKSIRELGLLFPLFVNPDNILIAGHRRLEACRRLGLTHVPVFRVDVEPDSLRALDLLIQENLCRRDLNVEELETLIGRKKELLGRLRRRGPWRRFMQLFRGKKRERKPAASRPSSTDR